MNVSMNNNILDVQDYWIDLKEVAELKGVNPRTVRLQKDKYIKREKSVRGGKTYEFLLTSLEPEIQEKFLQKYYNRITIETIEDIEKPLRLIQPKTEELVIPEIAKREALAKFDLVKLWREFVKDKHKTIASTEFLELYNTGMYAENIFKILGTVSLGSLHRWKRKLGRGNYTALISRSYNLSGEFKTTLTALEKNILMRLLLNPRQFSIGKAISMTTYILQKQGYGQFPAPITFKRYVDWFKKNNYDKWILAREGEKALKDKVEPFLVRDAKILNVFDVLVADGHVLNFEVINPFTGKPCRATLIGFLDWRSGALVGYEIMLEENTQAIASALRNAILNIGAIPKIVYQDNGRAFKSKFFHGKQGEAKLNRSFDGCSQLDFRTNVRKNLRACQGDKNFEE